jgi:amino acid transporter
MTRPEGGTGGVLQRGLGLREATALNMIDMVGIGPFVILPAVLGYISGPQCIIAWVSGALLTVIDGSIWAELGAAMPSAGGSYVFLRESFGPRRFGSLLSFLFIWQTIFQAPLVIASGAIGFSDYAHYLKKEILGSGRVDPGTIALPGFFHALDAMWPDWKWRAVAGLLVVLLVILLYRRITTIGRISLVLWTVVIGTILWLIFAGVTHFDTKLAFDYPAGAWNLSWPFWVAIGQATVQTIYTYLGYYNVCHLGDEIQQPERNIPRAIFISIGGITLLYIAMQLSVLGVVPWQVARGSKYVFSTFFEMIYGSWAGTAATVLILVIALSSLYSALLGYSRIPYAAARDGKFFSIFARVHPKKQFPYASLLIIGLLAFLFAISFRSLRDVVKAILAMRILVQFVGGAVGLMLLRNRWPKERFPFRMILYPLPVILAIIMWLFLFYSTGTAYAVGGLAVLGVGLIAFYIWAAVNHRWPFPERTPAIESRRSKAGSKIRDL